MSKQIPAVYEGGVIRPLEPPGLSEGEELDVILLPRQKQAEKNPSDTSGVSSDGRQESSAGAEPDARLALMREAMSDELFLADLREALEDFQHADAEETPA